MATLTISNGATDSPEFALNDARDFAILAPTTLPETVNLKVAEKTGGTFRTIQSGGLDVAIAAGKAVPFIGGPFTYFKLVATAAVAADRVFDVVIKSR